MISGVFGMFEIGWEDSEKQGSRPCSGVCE